MKTRKKTGWTGLVELLIIKNIVNILLDYEK